MKKNLLFSLALVVAVGLGSFFVAPDDLMVRSTLAFCISIAVLGGLAAGFFLSSLRAFKRDLRIAYVILAIGIVLFGLSQAVLPFYLIESIPVEFLSLTIVSLYFLSMLITYVGMWKFVTLLHIHTLWRSMLFVTGLALSIATLMNVILPWNGAGDILTFVIFGVFIAGSVFSIAATVLVAKIRKVLGSVYRLANSYLIGALCLAAIAAFHEVIIRVIPLFGEPQFSPYFDYGFNLWPFLLSLVLFLLASISFRRLSYQFGSLPEDPSYLDIVNYAAMQASTPAAIDVALDTVRTITARQVPEEGLSADDKAALVQVYQRIEDYLVTQEPLRRITREELRLALPDDFNRALAVSKKQAS